MADVIQVDRGYSPWAPAHDAQLVKEYQYYDKPLAGIIEQHGQRFFFSCLSGPDEPLNVWWYALVSPDEEATLERSPDAMMHGVHFDGPAVLALAIEGPGVVAVEVMDECTPETLHEAYEVLKRRLSEWAAAARTLEPELV